jgi:replicative DNA helicase
LTSREPPAYLDEPDRDVAQLRMPPHSIDAECAVLCGLLLDNSAWDRVGDLLTPADFYRFEHKQIFGAIGRMTNACKAVDVLTLFEDMQRAGGEGEKVGGLPYLNALAQSQPSAANIRRYAEIVREHAKRRQLVTVCDEISTAAFNLQGRTVEALLDEAAQKVMAVNTEAAEDEWEPLSVSVVKEIDRIQAAQDGNDPHYRDVIPTGQDHLDDVLDGGMRGGNLIVIGARPGHGKTALADTIGRYVAGTLGVPVGKFSMEMQNQEGAQRSIAAAGSIPLHALRRPERMNDLHWQSFTRAVETLRNYPFYSNERAGLNINQVRAKARALRRRHGVRLLLVDYFQLMSGTDPRLPRAQQLEEASRGMKSLAKELDIPVVLLAQVNRSVEKATDPMPRMSDLKDCGSLEQDADVILFLHRPKVHQPGLGDEWKHYAEGLVAKQRGGRTGKLDFDFDGQFTRYQPWPRGVPIPTSKVITGGRSDGSFE